MHMHKVPKLVLGLGGILVALGFVVSVGPLALGVTMNPAGGVIGCFAGIIILIIGSILSKVMKENPKVELTSTVNDESDD